VDPVRDRVALRRELGVELGGGDAAPHGLDVDDQVDALLDQARSEADPARRQTQYKQAMEIIMKDAPWIFLHSETQLTGYRREVQGLVMHPTERLLAMNAQLSR